MSEFTPFCLADFFAVKGIAFLACVLVVYLFWSGLRERREQRRRRQWLENKRRELKQKAAKQTEPPRTV